MRSLSSSTMRSSSDAPLLCRVLRFLGGSLGSDCPRFRVAGAFERGRVVRGAMKLRRESREWEVELRCGQRVRRDV